MCKEKILDAYFEPVKINLLANYFVLFQENIQKFAGRFFHVRNKSGKILPVEGGLKMSVFISKKLKETRSKAGISQEEASKKMGISERRMRSIEANQSEVSADEIIGFAKLYKVDVRELILESYVDEKEEQILCNRYASFLRLFDQLSDRDKEDVIWVIKQRISGAL